MKKSIIFAFLVSTIATSVQAAGQKDTAVIQAPDGSKFEVKVPKDAIKDVKQTGPNSYDVKIDRSEMKKIEVAPGGSPTPTPTPNN